MIESDFETEYEPHTIPPKDAFAAIAEEEATLAQEQQEQTERAQAIIDVLRIKLAQANEAIVGAEAEIVMLRKKLGLPSGLPE